MKRVLLLLPCAVFPYSLLAGIWCFLKGMGNLDEVFSFLPGLFCLTMACNIVFFILSVVKKWDGRSVSRCNMAVKLLQIPAYAVVFLLGVLSFSTLFTIGFAVVLLLFDCGCIFLTGLVGVAAAARCYADGSVSGKFAVINGLLQFVFCADVVSAVVLFVRSGAKPETADAALPS